MATDTIGALEQALGYEFKKRELIIEALTHRSHYHEYSDSAHNERLEFLGDAVIDLCVTETLMRQSPPDVSEGDLSKIRSQIVSEASLARSARQLALGQAVRLGRGEDQSGGRERESLLADTFEAVMAALYLEVGLDRTRTLVLKHLGVNEGTDTSNWRQSTEKLLKGDFKSRLQELCQGLGLGAPVYRCLETRGPDHQRRFVMGVFLGDDELIRAEGATKKEATQKAARSLLEVAVGAEGLLLYLEKRNIPMSEETRAHLVTLRRAARGSTKATKRKKAPTDVRGAEKQS